MPFPCFLKSSFGGVSTSCVLLVYAARNESAKSRSKRSWWQAQVAEMQR
jgi:hypothetical protein